MDTEKCSKELEKRERLVQTFLTIGGFFVAFAEGEFKQFAVAIFSIYLFFIILYYVFISRGFSTLIDYFAIFSSIPYSFLILVFFYSHAPNSWSKGEFWFIFVAQTCILSFSLLSPERSNQIIESSKKISISHPRVTKVVGLVLIVILIAWLIFQVLNRITFA